MEQRAAAVDRLIDLLESIWVQIDPDQEVEWRQALEGMDLDVAEQTVIILREASKIKPSIPLFTATYRGLKSVKKPAPQRHPKAEWFDEQRAKLRLVQARREESPRAS